MIGVDVSDFRPGDETARPHERENALAGKADLEKAGVGEHPVNRRANLETDPGALGGENLVVGDDPRDVGAGDQQIRGSCIGSTDDATWSWRFASAVRRACASSRCLPRP